jgi:hypothetical protein
MDLCASVVPPLVITRLCFLELTLISVREGEHVSAYIYISYVLVVRIDPGSFGLRVGCADHCTMVT